MSPAVRRAACVVGAVATAAAAACTGAGDPTPPPSPVTLSWAVPEQAPLREFWQQVADDFVATHPHVTVELVPGPERGNSLLLELQGDNPPHVYEQWGGVGLSEQVDLGLVKDLTDAVGADLGHLGGSIAGWQLGGRTYGVPYLARIEGFWYNKALVAGAGIGVVPSTIDDLIEAVRKLRQAGVVPIAVDANAGWPAVHYGYNFALRACPRESLWRPGDLPAVDDPCFRRASEDLAAFLTAEPFDENIFDWEYQTSASYLLATDRAGLLLSSSWALAEVEQWQPVGDRFGWFPFPPTGGAGDPGDQLGTGEGFSCSTAAPPECVELLKYIVSPEVQRQLGEAGHLLPVALGAPVTDPNLAPMLEALHGTGRLQLWLDSVWEPDVAQETAEAVMNQFRGTGTADDVVSAMREAAS